MSTNVTADNKLARVCHVIKRDDFDGYGFNLHAEKGKPGQYIGKVDDDSPAEAAGLRQGDRIIEVNAVNIGNETHKQVVQRIKAIACEVRLLVIDPMAVSVSPSNQILDDANAVKDDNAPSDVSNNNNSINNNNSNNSSTSSAATTTTNNNSSNCSNDSNTNNTNGLTNGLNGTTSNGNATNVSNDESDTVKSNAVSSSATSTPAPPPPSTNSMHYSSSHTNSMPTRPSPDKSTKGGLNLTMTAAELRAKLAAKKKYDPKNDSVDLRKKYEIVQKL